MATQLGYERQVLGSLAWVALLVMEGILIDKGYRKNTDPSTLLALVDDLRTRRNLRSSDMKHHTCVLSFALHWTMTNSSIHSSST